MKILGAGLSRTCTTSLAAALTQLGYNTLHWKPARLRDVIMHNKRPATWRRYDDVEAVTDLPAALFWRELLAAYPAAKCILTVRDEDRWFASVRWLFDQHIPRRFRGLLLTEAQRTQVRAYGSTPMIASLARQRYRDHNLAVQNHVPADRLLVMNIEAGDGWPKLCGFLGVSEPATPFPHLNQRRLPS